MAASGAPALALKAAIVTAVLAVLVLPSSGRCPSLGPEPPAPALPASAPVSAPAPAPTPVSAPVPCSDCSSRCYSTCDVPVKLQCSEECDRPNCEECRSEFIPKCEADCCVHGAGCNTCDCNGTSNLACFGFCSDRWCETCLRGGGAQSCRESCNKDCAATCF